METSNLQPNQSVTGNVRPKTSRSYGRWLTVIAVLLIVGAGSLFIAMNNDSTLAETTPNPTVTITDTGFEPKTLKVKKGESITWVNKDGNPHSVLADPNEDGSASSNIDSHEPMADGESYTATFDQTGTFNYHDKLNPAQNKATIIVE